MKNNLRLLMAERNINMTELANKTGLSRSTISNIYNEKSKRIDLVTLHKLCNFFGCGVGDLLQITPKDKTKEKEVV